MSKEAYLPSLFSLFRQYGYDGATLSKISETTGLGKASLYHHFPGGKNDMVTSVLDHAESWLAENVLTVLASEALPEERLKKMCDRLSELYAGGTQPCLLAVMQAGTGRDMFHDNVKNSLEALINAIAAVLVEAGLSQALARQRGESAIITIQGAVMLSQALDDPNIFQRELAQLPSSLCQTA
ncbi:MAG: TetR/AcrR family transcriptional regulator [Phormidesmis sp.]